MSAKKWLIAIPVLLVLVYFAGPAPTTPVYSYTMPEVPPASLALESYISQKEKQHHLKPDNEARIIWYNDSVKNKTDYAIVYLHGFSASQFEGAPTHKNIAKMFGCNLYLSRLAEHGIDTVEALVNLTADEYWESAKQALAIGKQLGKKVILMGTSTGGTNALQLAAAYPDDIAVLILLSPNIAINDPNAWILNNHWGIEIANMVKGSSYNIAKDTRPVYKQYWNYQYRLEAAVALEEYLETAMTKETFQKVKQPVLLLYYYKDEQHQDPVVKVSAMKEMFDKLGTTANLKREVAMPNTGDHVIGSPFKSQDASGVQNEIEKYMREVMKLKKVQTIVGDLYFDFFRFGSFYAQPDSVVRGFKNFVDTVDRKKIDDDTKRILIMYETLKREDLLYNPFIDLRLDNDSIVKLYLGKSDYDKIKIYKRQELQDGHKKIRIKIEGKDLGERMLVCKKLISVDKVEGRTSAIQGKFKIDDYE